MKKPLSLRKVLATLLTIAALFAGQQAFATGTFTVTSSTNGTTTTFTITRAGNTSVGEIVDYRTVSLSALAGKHFTEAIGSVTFSAGDLTKTVTVTETAIADVEASYRFQDGTSRSYRFEVLDKDGYVLAFTDHSISYSTDYKIVASDFDEKTLTVSSSETTAGNGGYGSNPYVSMAGSNYYNIAAPQDYLSAMDAELRMTLDFQAKEVEDGYQYIQILFDPTNNGCDERPSNASNGDPGTPNLSRYMAGFEHQHGSKNTNYAPYSFPLTDYGDNCGAVSKPWTSLGNSVGDLTTQKFNTDCRAADGRLIIPTAFTNFILRLNASGSGGDDWTLKNVVAHIQAVTTPTVLTPYTVSGGRRQKGNTIYVSVSFNEIVYITGTTKKLTTTWGDLTYIEGNGTNVLTFQGEISSSATGAFRVTGYSGTIKDMADIQFNGSIGCNFGIGLNSEYAWSLGDFNSLGSNNYGIATTTDLRHLALMVNGNYNDCSGLTFKQTADIAFSTTGLGSTDENYITIGGYFNGSDKNFKGTYDGQNHTISNIRLYKPQTNQNANKNQALFGRAINATVKNVILVDASITGYRIVGGIVGHCEGSTVQNCLVMNSSITCADTYVGAVIARNQSGNTFTNNHYRTCTVNGTANATNVGVGANGTMGSSSDRNGVRSVHPLTIQNTNVTATGESVTYQSTTYYASNTTITLGYNNLPAGYQVTYTLNGTALSGNTFTMPANDNATVNAEATLITYTIAYNLDGGSVSPANPTTYTIETPTFTLTNPTKTGYTFTGWTGTGLTQPTLTVTITQGSTGNRSYTANWTPITYNIIYDLDGGSVATANPTTYNIETPTFTLNNPTKTGYTFVGWTGSNGTTPQTTVTITQGSIGDLSYTAHWTLVTYNITYDLDGGEATNPTTYTVETETFTLAIPTKTGYGFTGWTGTDLTQPTQTVTITQGSTGDRSYTAHWTDVWNIAGGADGSEEHPYLISTTAGLDLLATEVNNGNTFSGIYFKLGNDIAYDPNNLTIDNNGDGTNDSNFTSIGGYFSGDQDFKGIFDGDGKAISGIRLYKDLTNSANANKNVALFGRANNAIIKNVIVVDASFTGYRIVAGIVGNCISTTVQNCLVLNSTLTSGNNYVGAVIGKNDSNNTFTNNYYHNCTVTVGTTSATTNVGVGGDGGVSSSSDQNGVRSVHALTWGEDITATGTVAVTYNNTDYYLAGTEITLTYSGTPPEGYRLAYFTVNNEPVEGNTFEMPAADVVVNAVLLERYYTFNNTTGELALIFGAFNKDDMWGWDPMAVTSVTATNEVSFTGSCFNMFCFYINCTSMDLSNVNTDNVTNMTSMFSMCFNLTTIEGISGWNTANVTDMSYMFYDCEILTTLDLSGWNTANVTNMESMFFECQSLQSLDLSGWNTANVTDMSGMFWNCHNLQSLDLSGWNTANVTDMNSMFYGCSGLQSLNLSGWNTGNVTDMGHMFSNCLELETLDLSDWNTANVTNMSWMIDGCLGLQSLDLSGWNTANVTDMSGMFWNCYNLQSLDLSGWNTANVTDMGAMFNVCPNLNTIYVGEGWSTENLTNSNGMFYGCTSLVGGMGTEYDEDYTDAEYARIDHGWDEPGYLTGVFALTLADDITASPAATLTHSGVNLYAAGATITLSYGGEMPEGYAPVYSVNGNPFSGNSFEMPFEDATVTVDVQLARYAFNSETGELTLLYGEFNKDNKWGNDVPADEVTSVTATNEVSFTGDCSELFEGFTICESMDLSNVNTDEMTNTFLMFGLCSSLETLDLSGWNTANVTDMSIMFAYCDSLTSIVGLSDFNTTHVDGTGGMFMGCISIETLDLTGWNTGNVTDMNAMFYNCTSLTSIEGLSDFNMTNVTDMFSMFSYCESLETLDISNWNTANVTDMGAMFNGCPNLTTIYVGEGWSTENVVYSENMFGGCTSLVGGMGTEYDEDYIDAEYARIDGGPDNPGYFTEALTITLYKDIVGYGNSDGGYYLIASPVGMVNPENVSNMTANEYDLYRFNPSNEGNEWENYKAESFNLEKGKGYIYANSNTVTLTFTGHPIAGDTYEVTLVYDANDSRKCWNLVGNPFDNDATLDREYYVLDNNGLDINPEPIPANTPIPPCTAVFVKAVSDGDTVVFTKVTK